MLAVSPARLLASLVVPFCVAATVGLFGWRAGAGLWPGVLALVAGVALVLRGPLRRARAAGTPLPPEAAAWFTTYVPLYTRADAEGRARFEHAARVFLGEQRFEAIAGTTWTDARRLAVAAGAATIFHGRPGWTFSTRRSFLLYPSTFDNDYHDDAREGEFDGMAHQQGPVIFSAPALDDAWAFDDGQNVVVHELAHLLDFTGTGVDGAPSLMDPASGDAWAALVRRETQRVKVGKSLLRAYAATNAAEFFAVATEVFFERPTALGRRHPELFAALAAFFQLDPRSEERGSEQRERDEEQERPVDEDDEHEEPEREHGRPRGGGRPARRSRSRTVR